MTKQRNPGRPRDDSVDRRVLEATLSILADDGMGGLSIESIAATSGVSKSSIYRRWPSKDEILVDAIGTVAESVSVVDTGALRDDLISALNALRSLVSDTRAGEVFPWLVSEMANRTNIGLMYLQVVVLPRRQSIVDLLTAARDRGDLLPGFEIETAVDILTGPIILRKMTDRLGTTPPDWPQTVVDLVLTGWLSPAT